MLRLAERREAEVEAYSLIRGKNSVPCEGSNARENDIYWVVCVMIYEVKGLMTDIWQTLSNEHGLRGLRGCGARRIESNFVKSWRYVISIDFEKATTTVFLCLQSRTCL